MIAIFPKKKKYTTVITCIQVNARDEERLFKSSYKLNSFFLLRSRDLELYTIVNSYNRTSSIAILDRMGGVLFYIFLEIVYIRDIHFAKSPRWVTVSIHWAYRRTTNVFLDFDWNCIKKVNKTQNYSNMSANQFPFSWDQFKIRILTKKNFFLKNLKKSVLDLKAWILIFLTEWGAENRKLNKLKSSSMKTIQNQLACESQAATLRSDSERSELPQN